MGRSADAGETLISNTTNDSKINDNNTRYYHTITIIIIDIVIIYHILSLINGFQTGSGQTGFSQKGHEFATDVS